MSDGTRWRVEVNAQIHPPLISEGGGEDIARRFGLSGTLSRSIGQGGVLEGGPGEIGVILGPSGSGKSVLLSEVASALPGAIRLRTISPKTTKHPAEWVGTKRVSDALKLLSMCGLADAAALLTPAGRLSEGEKFRLCLARAIGESSRRGTVLLIDEFASTLDAVTAAILARRLRRIVSRSPWVYVVL